MKRKTIRNNKDFYVAPDGIMVWCDLFLIKVKPAKIDGDARYGIITTKRSFKLAIDRNRVKRMMRDWIAFNENLMMPEFDYVFIPRVKILGTERDIGRSNMKILLKKIIKKSQSNG